MNYKLDLNLAHLDGAFIADVVTNNGANRKCVCVPVYDNDIFLSERGGAYLHLVAWQVDGKDWGTHMVQRSMSAADRGRLQEQGRQVPIVGNLSEMKSNNNSNING